MVNFQSITFAHQYFFISYITFDLILFSKVRILFYFFVIYPSLVNFEFMVFKRNWKYIRESLINCLILLFFYSVQRSCRFYLKFIIYKCFLAFEFKHLNQRFVLVNALMCLILFLALIFRIQSLPSTITHSINCYYKS